MPVPIEVLYMHETDYACICTCIHVVLFCPNQNLVNKRFAPQLPGDNSTRLEEKNGVFSIYKYFQGTCKCKQRRIRVLSWL